MPVGVAYPDEKHADQCHETTDVRTGRVTDPFHKFAGVTKEIAMVEQEILSQMKRLADELVALRSPSVAVVLIEPTADGYEDVASQLMMEDVCCSPTGT